MAKPAEGTIPVPVQNLFCGRLFRRLRLREDRTQADVAESCELTQSALSRFESGAVALSWAEVDNLRDELWAPTFPPMSEWLGAAYFWCNRSVAQEDRRWWEYVEQNAGRAGLVALADLALAITDRSR